MIIIRKKYSLGTLYMIYYLYTNFILYYIIIGYIMAIYYEY